MKDALRSMAKVFAMVFGTGAAVFVPILLAVLSLPASAQQATAGPKTVGEVLDGQFKILDQEVISLVEAMPADKFNFAPTSTAIKGGEFTGVRTFAQQAKHLAANIYDFSSGVLGENPPVDTGKDNDGPDSIQTKEQVLAYVKGAFAYGHKALLSLTAANEMEQPKGGPHIGAAIWMMWHSMDHYGLLPTYCQL